MNTDRNGSAHQLQLRSQVSFTSVIVSGNYLRDHPDVVENVVRGLLEAQAFISFPANRNIVLRAMMHHMKLNDLAILDEGYQNLLVGFEKKPYGSADALRNIQRMMGNLNPKVSRIKVDEIIDNRFIRKLDESGYIDGLYSKG